MNDSTLLIPDSGPGFLETLKLAILYSDTVHVFTFTDEKISRSLAAQMSIQRCISAILEKPLDFDEIESSIALEESIPDSIWESLPDETPGDQFLAFTSEEAAFFALAKQEKVLYSVSDNAFHSIKGKQAESLKALEDFLKSVLTEAQTTIQEYHKSGKLQACIKGAPPSLFFLLGDLFSAGFKYALSVGKFSELGTDVRDKMDNMLLSAAFVGYMSIASYYALSNGLAAVTWQAPMQGVFDVCSNAVKQGLQPVNELLHARQRVTRKLGQLILQEAVPNVTGLPLEVILEIRRKRTPELLSFRDGLRQIAADIDPTLDGDSLELELDSTIQKVVKPAMRNLRNSISELRLDAYNQLLHPSKELGVALIPAIISLSAGASLGTVAEVSGVSALLAKLYEFTIGKRIAERKVLNASNWSILYELEKRSPEFRL